MSYIIIKYTISYVSDREHRTCFSPINDEIKLILLSIIYFISIAPYNNHDNGWHTTILQISFHRKATTSKIAGGKNKLISYRKTSYVGDFPVGKKNEL